MTLSGAGHPHELPKTGLSCRLSLLGAARTPRRPRWRREQDPSGDTLFQTEVARSTTYG